MARSLRQSRFRRRDELAEDVNPSAYIVNLADCMLVLACGFMVAMMVFWNIDLKNVEELEQESLEQVDPEDILDSIQNGGSYYVEAGTVYMDPNTGQLWMVRNDVDGGGGSGSGGTGVSGSGDGTGGGGENASGPAGGSSSGSGAGSRAEGAD